MRRGLVVLGLLIAALVVARSGAPASTRIVRFQTPSRNIGCGYSPAARGQPAVLRCDIRSGLNPAPRRNCMLDWVGMTVGASGRGRPECAGDTVYSRTARVLGYGRTWRAGRFACTSRRTGLTCRNASGHGFVLARASWRAF